jgi:hypothetical protein
MENVLGTMGVSSTFINGERAWHDERLVEKECRVTFESRRRPSSVAENTVKA